MNEKEWRRYQKQMAIETRVIPSWQFRLCMGFVLVAFFSTSVQIFTGNFFGGLAFASSNFQWWQAYWLFGNALSIMIGGLLFLWSLIQAIQ